MMLWQSVSGTNRFVSPTVAARMDTTLYEEFRRMTHPNDDFRLEWHGNTVVITPTGNVEGMNWELIEQAAEVVLGPIREQHAAPMVVFDLSQVNYFGSVFLALLLRCHKNVRSRGGELVLCGLSETARELLKITALDTVWAIYESKEAALKAVDS